MNILLSKEKDVKIMNEKISEFKKRKGYLVCVDSDGCAIDTMEVKHRKCFGPEAIKEWGLEEIQDLFQETWNRVNLYSKTRGINRFKEMPDVSSIAKWTNTAAELSNPALEKETSQTNDKDLMKALNWSYQVNEAINQLPEDDKPFPKVREGLEVIYPQADIAIVSSANGGAIRAEWERHELDQYVSVMLGQEAGNKTFCIKSLKEGNYQEDDVLMIGDAPGDLEAALANKVLYYPILAGKEKFSWERLMAEAFEKFLDGSYRGEYQQGLIDEFNSSLQ